jgi:peptidoglycan/xylan/chitin deacetylase (PgdA/CDA1 family)
VTCRSIGFSILASRGVQKVKAIFRPEPIVLMYHGVPLHRTKGIDAKVFEQHLEYLQQSFEIVRAESVWRASPVKGKPRLAITFDDGFQNQAEIVAPILRRRQIPATFFVSSRHCVAGKYLWFSYLRALEDKFQCNGFYAWGEFVDMSPAKRHASMIRLREALVNLEPHPGAMYRIIDNELPRLEDFVGPTELSDEFAGMTAEQVGELASEPLFSVGIHTVDHPFLTRCGPDEILRQITDNKNWIEVTSNRRTTSMAYPAGRYDAGIIETCRSLKLDVGFAIVPTINADCRFEVQRVGIYSPAVSVLAFKARWGNIVERLRFQIAGNI